MSEMTQDTRTHWHLGRTTGSAATAFALAVGMMGTTLPTPLYARFNEPQLSRNLELVDHLTTIEGAN